MRVRGSGEERNQVVAFDAEIDRVQEIPGSPKSFASRRRVARFPVAMWERFGGDRTEALSLPVYRIAAAGIVPIATPTSCRIGANAKWSTRRELADQLVDEGRHIGPGGEVELVDRHEDADAASR